LINNTISKINYELIYLYWSIGKLVNDYKKDNNSQYGDAVVTRFSKELSLRYGKGFDQKNIFKMVKFYDIFSKVAPGRQSNNKIFSKIASGQQSNEKFAIWHPDVKLKNINWSHIRELLKFKDIKIINYYLSEVENKNWTKNELIHAIKSKSYERTIGNQRKGTISNKIEKTLKDPVILNISNKKRTEKELEDEIINNVFEFMKEIGNSVMLYGRQYKININGLTHKIDLVFFDNDINSYILVDLKINKITNKDIFQMQMYINYFNKYMKKGRFNNTIGIILCETKDIRVEANDNIYQIKYLSEIPKEKELLKIINENKVILLKTENLKIK